MINRKKLLRQLSSTLLPPFAALLMKIIYLTTKKVYHYKGELPDKPLIFLFWHNDILMEPLQYLHFRKNPNIKLLISDHYDGQLIAKAMKYYKFGNIAGSSNSNPTKVLIQAMKFIKSGGDIGLTPDGPRGPRYSISKGTIIIAQKTDTPVVIFNSRASRYRAVKSWDKFVIPKLFGRVDYYASAPIYLSDLSYEEAEKKVKDAMMVHAYD